MFEVIRVEKTKDYTTISNRHLKDTGLSLKAKGLMTVMLALPNESWDLTIEGLAAICKDGRRAIASGLQELEDAGYYSKRKVRENGKIVGWVHTLTELPQSRFADVENADVQNAELQNADVQNSTQLNTYELSTYQSNTYQSSTYEYTPPKKFIPPTVDEVQAYCMERGNNIDAEYFVSYYEARGWSLGKGTKMKNWKSAVVTWEKNNFSQDRQKKQTATSYFLSQTGV